MRLTPSYYAQAWHAALHEVPTAQWSTVSRRVLQHVYRHGHVKWLPEIVRMMTSLEYQRSQTTPVIVRSAHPLDRGFAQQIVQRYLPPSMSADIRQEVDDRLIGGVQIETENVRYNTSIRSQLNQLAHYVRN